MLGHAVKIRFDSSAQFCLIPLVLFLWEQLKKIDMTIVETIDHNVAKLL